MTYSELLDWVHEKLEILDGLDSKEKQKERRYIAETVKKEGQAMLEPIVQNWFFYRERPIRLGRVSDSYGTHGTCIIRGSSDEATVNISKHIFFQKNEERVVNCMLHELIHAMLPKNAGHGQYFQLAMKAANVRLGSKIDVYAPVSRADGVYTMERTNQYRYEIVCKNCHRVLKRYKHAGKYVKHPNEGRCSVCHGDIEAVEL